LSIFFLGGGFDKQINIPSIPCSFSYDTYGIVVLHKLKGYDKFTGYNFQWFRKRGSRNNDGTRTYISFSAKKNSPQAVATFSG
jgi:hypothetical protein